MQSKQQKKGLHNIQAQVHNMKTLMMYQMWNMMMDMCDNAPQPSRKTSQKPKYKNKRQKGQDMQSQKTPKTQPEEYSRLYSFWNRLKCALTDDEIDDILDMCDIFGNYRVENKIKMALDYLFQTQEQLLRDAQQYITQPTPKEPEKPPQQEKKEEKEEKREVVEIPSPPENVFDNRMEEDENPNVIYDNTPDPSMVKQTTENHTPAPQQTPLQSTIRSPHKRRRGQHQLQNKVAWNLSPDDENWSNGGKKLVGPCKATANMNPQYQGGGEMRPVGPLKATQYTPPKQPGKSKENISSRRGGQYIPE